MLNRARDGRAGDLSAVCPDFPGQEINYPARLKLRIEIVLEIAAHELYDAKGVRRKRFYNDPAAGKREAQIVGIIALTAFEDQLKR